MCTTSGDSAGCNILQAISTIVLDTVDLSFSDFDSNKSLFKAHYSVSILFSDPERIIREYSDLHNIIATYRPFTRL